MEPKKLITHESATRLVATPTTKQLRLRACPSLLWMHALIPFATVKQALGPHLTASASDACNTNLIQTMQHLTCRVPSTEGVV